MKISLLLFSMFTFANIMQQGSVKLLSSWPESKQWNQSILAVIMFFIVIPSEEREKMPFSLKIALRGFLGGPVVKNSPTNAVGHGFDPWSGKIPHTTGQLSPPPHQEEPPQEAARTCNYRGAPTHRN